MFKSHAEIMTIELFTFNCVYFSHFFSLDNNRTKSMKLLHTPRNIIFMRESNIPQEMEPNLSRVSSSSVNRNGQFTANAKWYRLLFRNRDFQPGNESETAESTHWRVHRRHAIFVMRHVCS